MPLKWEQIEGAPDGNAGASSFEAGGEPLARLALWPHRSLPREGFVVFIGITFLLVLMPLMAVIGTAVLWGLLPFVMGALALIWWALQRNYRDGALREDLALWPDRVELIRTDPRGPAREWVANPYWVQIELHEKGGPVPQYLTLKGGGREVEIGAFLSPEERIDLHGELSAAFTRARASMAARPDP